MERKVVNIRLSVEEKRYAKALSRRHGCRIEDGSVGYGIKVALREQAKRDGLPDVMGSIYRYASVLE
jgi:hypothetical protein